MVLLCFASESTDGYTMRGRQEPISIAQCLLSDKPYNFLILTKNSKHDMFIPIVTMKTVLIVFGCVFFNGYFF